MPDILDKCKTGKEITNLDLSKESNFMKVSRFTLGTGTETDLSKLVRDGTISSFHSS